MLEELEKSLELLSKDWEIDPKIKNFILGNRNDVKEFTIKVDEVVFHIPFLTNENSYILWKCYWPDCHNCCNRQGRLPLTSNDLITISKKLKYKNTSDFIKNETNIVNWQEADPSGKLKTTMTTVNLKRKVNETIDEDGTYITCRFLDDTGYCSLHPERPGVCYLYPFSSWLENERGRAIVHATFQFTGDCPGFYLSNSIDPMNEVLHEYSKTIFEYNMRNNRTIRENFSSSTIEF